MALSVTYLADDEALLREALAKLKMAKDPPIQKLSPSQRTANNKRIPIANKKWSPDCKIGGIGRSQNSLNKKEAKVTFFNLN